MNTVYPRHSLVGRFNSTVYQEVPQIATTVLTPHHAVGKVCLVPRGRTQRTPKDGVPVAAGEGTEEGDKPRGGSPETEASEGKKWEVATVGESRGRGFSGHLYSQAEALASPSSPAVPQAYGR
jgi:hypothetical protein